MRPHEQLQSVRLWLATELWSKWLALPDENILSETKNIVKLFDFASDRG